MADEIKTLSDADNHNATIKLEWSKGYIGMPHAIARSGLFSAGHRRQLDGDVLTDIPTNGSCSVKIQSISTLSVADLIVFLAIMHICWTQDDDRYSKSRVKRTRIDCTLGDIAEAMGRKRNTSTAKHIFGSLERLARTHIEIKGKGYFSGSLISIGSDLSPDKAVSTGYKVEIYVNPKLQELYRGGHWTALKYDIIKALGRNQLAQWLYCFFGTHKVDYDKGAYGKFTYFYGLNKIQELSGTNLPSRIYVGRVHNALELISQTSMQYAISPDDLVFLYDIQKTDNKHGNKDRYKITALFRRKYLCETPETKESATAADIADKNS